MFQNSKEGDVAFDGRHVTWLLCRCGGNAEAPFAAWPQFLAACRCLSNDVVSQHSVPASIASINLYLFGALIHGKSREQMEAHQRASEDSGWEGQMPGLSLQSTAPPPHPTASTEHAPRLQLKDEAMHKSYSIPPASKTDCANKRSRTGEQLVWRGGGRGGGIFTSPSHHCLEQCTKRCPSPALPPRWGSQWNFLFCVWGGR